MSERDLSVGLVARRADLSPHLRVVQRAAKAGAQSHGAETVDQPYCAPRRLTEAQRSQVIELYAAGSSFADVAATVGLARSTAMRIVKEAGIPVRPHRKITEAQIDEAVEQYESGQHAREIGESMDLSTECIRKHLLERGVVMREGRGGRQN